MEIKWYNIVQHGWHVYLAHVAAVRGEGVEEGGGRHHAELAVVLGVEDGVGAEGLGDVLVEVRGERQLGVQVVHQRPATTHCR